MRTPAFNVTNESRRTLQREIKRLKKVVHRHRTRLALVRFAGTEYGGRRYRRPPSWYHHGYHVREIQKTLAYWSERLGKAKAAARELAPTRQQSRPRVKHDRRNRGGRT